MRDLRYALRRLWHSPLFTIGATVTLALAIGATASVFSVVDGVLLKAFPYRDPNRVMTVFETNASLNLPQTPVAPGDYLDFRAQNHAFSALAAISYQPYTITGQGDPQRVIGFAVTPDYFPAIGVAPVVGRPLSSDSSTSEAVIGYGLWQRLFGGDPAVLGKTLTLDDHPFTVVGVMPAGMPEGSEVWTRLTFSAADQAEHGAKTLSVVGRLRPDATREAAQREMAMIANRLAQAYPLSNKGWGTRVDPIVRFFVGNVQTALLMLLAAAACVLLIGAANLANLFLVRCLGREREIALRTALGATRGRVIRELLVEAATVGLVAGALGVGVARFGVSALRALAPATLPRLSEIQVDGRVVAFCAIVSIATVLLFGMAPAWQAARGQLSDVLKGGGRGTGSTRHHRLQDGLVVLQMAVALVLLTGAGLLVESFDHFQRMDTGFRPESVLTAEIALPVARYATPEQQAAFATRLVETLERQGGIQSASASDILPSGENQNALGFNVVGTPTPDPTHMPLAFVVAASPQYFRTLGIALRKGRAILPTDDTRAAKVAVVDALLATRYFGTRDPIGARITLIGGPDTMTVVGVVASVKQGGLTDESAPGLYLSFAQSPNPVIELEVRTSGEPERATGAVRQAVAALDPTVPTSHVETMNARLASSVSTTRFSSFLASLFAVVALILAAVGIYSVLASIVGQRQREIGIRLALGASRFQVMSEVLRRALALTGFGIAIGSAVAWLVTRALAGLFVSVSAHDPVILIGAAVVFALVALAAASVPAFRTTRINPTEALKAT